jgi:hypothetical protein
MERIAKRRMLHSRVERSHGINILKGKSIDLRFTQDTAIKGQTIKCVSRGNWTKQLSLQELLRIAYLCRGDGSFVKRTYQRPASMTGGLRDQDRRRRDGVVLAHFTYCGNVNDVTAW